MQCSGKLHTPRQSDENCTGGFAASTPYLVVNVFSSAVLVDKMNSAEPSQIKNATVAGTLGILCVI